MCAKQRGFIKLKGSLGGLTFYQSGGDDVVKTTGGPDKEKINNDPAFKRTRENMREFSGSAQVGKAFRVGFAMFLKLMSDRYFTGRLTGLMKKINSYGSGKRGARSFSILANKASIVGLEFNNLLPLASVFFAPFTQVVDALRGKVTITIPDFSTDSYVNAPEGASHFKLVLVLGTLSDYTFVNPGIGYEAVNPALNSKSAFAMSSSIPLTGQVGNDLVLIADLGNGVVLPNTLAVNVALGVVFYQEINGDLYELASKNAMKIIDVV